MVVHLGRGRSSAIRARCSGQKALNSDAHLVQIALRASDALRLSKEGTPWSRRSLGLS
jgi:hypothetical protein